MPLYLTEGKSTKYNPVYCEHRTTYRYLMTDDNQENGTEFQA